MTLPIDEVVRELERLADDEELLARSRTRVQLVLFRQSVAPWSVPDEDLGALLEAARRCCGSLDDRELTRVVLRVLERTTSTRVEAFARHEGSER